MASLVESGMKNLNFGDADSVGFFQMRVSIWDSGAVQGLRRTSRSCRSSGSSTRRRRSRTRGSRRASRSTTRTPTASGSPTPSGRPSSTAAATRPSSTEAQGPAEEPRRGAAAAPPRRRSPVVDAAAVAPAGGGGEPARLGGADHRQAQLGVAEVGGANRGQQVEEYLAAAKVAPGNPWCASFVTWSLEKAGHKMPGGGWAAVQTWVRNAEQGKNGLQIVSAEDARPGRHRRLRLGRPGGLRQRRPHRLPRQHGPGRQVHGAGGQQRRQGELARSRANIKFPDRGGGEAVVLRPRRRCSTCSPTRRTRSRRVQPAVARRTRRTRSPAAQPVARGGRARAADRPDAVRRRGHRRRARAPRRSRCWRTRTSCSTPTGSRTSRPAGSTRASWR